MFALLSGLVLHKEVFKGQLINPPQSEAQLKNKRLDMNPQQYEWLSEHPGKVLPFKKEALMCLKQTLSNNIEGDCELVLWPSCVLLLSFLQSIGEKITNKQRGRF